MKRSQAVMIAVLLTAAMTLPAHASSYRQNKGRVTLLPATSEWFEARSDYRPGSALGRNGAFGKGYYSIYLMDLAPGTDYTLGLRYPADSAQKPAVLLFDNWPGEPGAKRYKFPMGPVVRTNYEKIEYRWRLAVSPRSEGSLAFLVVESKQNFSGTADPFRYFIYLTTPAISPIRQIGEGITYLRGPSDLILPEPSGTVQYVVEYPYTMTGDRRGREFDSDGNLIKNGNFSRGLRYWEVAASDSSANGSGQVSVGNDGLRLGNVNPGESAGVRQSIKRYVRDARSLLFSSNLKIDDPTSMRLRQSDDNPMLQISICYVDKKGNEHCGEDAYRRNFTTTGKRSKNSRWIEVENGRWYRFEEEIMDLFPKPNVIESVSVTGIGLKDTEAWIDSISLVVR
ncbi:MAG: hypothetical protein ACC669_04175 [bacterium]